MKSQNLFSTALHSVVVFVGVSAVLGAALGCESSPFKDGSSVREDPEQAVIDGNGPADGGAVGAMEPGIVDDENDVDQDPNIGGPM